MKGKLPIASLPIRGYDRWGSGEYLASRGDRQHEGLDLACYPGTGVFPVRPGRVTKLGYSYADDLSYRFVEVIDSKGNSARYHYVEPAEGLKVDDMVGLYDCIGEVQDIRQRYEDITCHYHLEVRNVDGVLLDPKEYYRERA